MSTTQDRMRSMRNAVHSVEMEGGEVDQETREQMAAHARGEITADQLQDWALAHARQVAAEEG